MHDPGEHSTLAPPSIDADSFGTFIDAFSLYFQRPNVGDFSWGEVQRAREVIMAYLASEGQAINVAKFKDIPDMRAFFLERVGQERSSSFDVSNLGMMRCVNSVEEAWEIGRCVFSRSAFVGGSAFSVGAMTGGDGCLVLGFVWQKGIVGVDFIEEIVGLVERQVDILALEPQDLAQSY